MQNFWEENKLKGSSLRTVRDECRQLQRSLQVNYGMFLFSILGPLSLGGIGSFVWVYYHRTMSSIIGILIIYVVMCVIACIWSWKLIGRKIDLDTALNQKREVLAQFNQAVYALDPVHKTEHSFRDKRLIDPMLAQYAYYVHVAEHEFEVVRKKNGCTAEEMAVVVENLKDRRQMFHDYYAAAEQFGITVSKPKYFEAAAKLIGDII
jgi:hypothetical protein